MNEALIQHSQDQIDHENCCGDQVGLSREGGLKCLRGSLECSVERCRLAHCGLCAPNGVDGGAERRSRGQIEGKRYCGELALMAHREIVAFRRVESDERAQWDHLSC